MKLFRSSDDATDEDETAQDENGATAMSQETTAQGSDGDYDRTLAGTTYENPGTTSYEDADPSYRGTDDSSYQDTSGSSYPDGNGSGEQPQPTFTPAGTTTDDPSATSTTVRASGATVVNPVPGSNEPVAASPADPASDYQQAAPAAPASPYEPADAYQPATDDDPAAAAPAPAAAGNADASAYQDPSTVTADARPMDEPVATTTAASAANQPLLGGDIDGMRANWQKVQSEFVDDPKTAVLDAAALIEQTAKSLVDALEQRQQQLRGDASVTQDAGAAATTGGTDTEHLRQMMQRYRTLFDQLCRV